MTPRQPPPAPARFELLADEVHVWLAWLELPAERLERLRGTLAPDERERAARFRFERDRRRFVAARGMLRELLGRYAGRDPASIAFDLNAYGKPSLPNALAGGLRFNLSHAHEVALLAVSRGRDLGVDIEHFRPDLPLAIADRYFSPGELADLRSVPEPLRPTAFLNCWTRKEAYIKARGEGLSLALDSFDVTLIPGEPARLLEVRGALSDTRRWSLRALPAPAGYCAAIVVGGADGWQLRLRQWP